MLRYLPALMSLAKLNKYLNKYSAAVIPAQSQKLRVPVVLVYHREWNKISYGGASGARQQVNELIG